MDSELRDMIMLNFYTSDLIPVNMYACAIDPPYSTATKLYTVQIEIEIQRGCEAETGGSVQERPSGNCGTNMLETLQVCTHLWWSRPWISRKVSYTRLFCRAKQMVHELKRDKLEQQLQRDTELEREQAATCVQAWWRGHRWVVYIIQVFV